MPTFKSFEDLKSLLSEEDHAAEDKEPRPTKTGYDGRAQVLNISLDNKRRRGKIVTLIAGFQVSANELDAIAGSLKKSCGAGGRAIVDVIELQGDHRGKVTEELRAMGFEVEQA